MTVPKQIKEPKSFSKTWIKNPRAQMRKLVSQIEEVHI